MPYNISARCEIGPILSRRVLPQRAVKQARDYRRLGYTDITIIDVESGEIYETNALAALVQARLAAAEAKPA